MLKWGICGFGALLAILGLVWGISGWGMVEMERGWSSVLAGAMVFAAGSIILAIAALMHRIEELIGELHRAPQREAQTANEVPSARALPQVQRPADRVPVQQSFDTALAEAAEKAPEASPEARPQGRPAFAPPPPPPGMDASPSSRKPSVPLSETLPPAAVASAAGAAAIESALSLDTDTGSEGARDEAAKPAAERPQLRVIGGRAPEERPPQVLENIEAAAVPATRPVAPPPSELPVPAVPRISVPPLAPIPQRAAWPEPPAGVVADEEDGEASAEAATDAPVETPPVPPAPPPAPAPNIPIPNLPPRPVLPPDIRRIPAAAPSLPAAAMAPVAAAAPRAAAPIVPASVAPSQEPPAEPEKDNAQPVTAGDGMVDNEAPAAAAPPPLPASPVAPPPYQGSAWVDKLFAELDDIADAPAGAGAPARQQDMIDAAKMAREIESDVVDARTEAEEERAPASFAEEAAPATVEALSAEAVELPVHHAQEHAPAEDVAAASPQASDTEPAPERVLLRSYESQGVNYHLYEDGSIDAETSGGTFRFASLEELRQFIEKRSG